MKQYLDLCKYVLDKGVWVENRTCTRTLAINGYMMQYDLQEGFPAVTTKKLNFDAIVAEMLCFLRGESNNKKFVEAGCNVWTANANADYWLNNPNHSGEEGDLGRIYGVQARDWNGEFDQLREVVDKLIAGKADRRMIVSHWNPSELAQMALPPCHLLYQFGVLEDKLNLTLYQRSADIPLGVPFNIAGYSWLLSVIAKVTGYEVGTFTHFIHDAHIYENQIDPLMEQLEREPKKLPELWIHPVHINTFEDLETKAGKEHFLLVNYNHHPAIKIPFTV
jgi:thymidylate synthase